MLISISDDKIKIGESWDDSIIESQDNVISIKQKEI